MASVVSCTLRVICGVVAAGPIVVAVRAEREPIELARIRRIDEFSGTDRAESLLAELDDDDSLIDRFLLLGLQRRHDELAHPLQLDPAAPEHPQDSQLCLLLAGALISIATNPLWFSLIAPLQKWLEEQNKGQTCGW